MENASEKNIIRLLSISLIISLLAISFITNKYFELAEDQSNSLFNAQLQNSRPPKTILSNTASVVISQEVVPSWRTYNNKKIGFEIQLPDSWQGYSVSASSPTSVGFSFSDTHQPFTIFQINRYTKVQWNALKKNSQTKLADQPDGSVLACDGCCTITTDTTGGGQFDQFQIARCKEVPSILRTLKLSQ